MLEVPGQEWTSVGKHQHRFELPDLYVVQTIGDVSESDMVSQINALRALAPVVKQGIFWLADVRHMGAFNPAARRAAAAAGSSDLREVVRGSAVYGASFGTRVLVTLMSRAVRLLNPSRSRPVAFVETEAEARAFLRAHGQGRTRVT